MYICMVGLIKKLIITLLQICPETAAYSSQIARLILPRLILRRSLKLIIACTSLYHLLKTDLIISRNDSDN